MKQLVTNVRSNIHPTAVFRVWGGGNHSESQGSLVAVHVSSVPRNLWFKSYLSLEPPSGP